MIDRKTESRKIQEVGGGTYTVSLPKEWAESEDVSQGTVVNVHAYADGVLAVQTDERETDTVGQVTLDVTSAEPEQAKRLLRAAYSLGYEEMTLSASEPLGARHRAIRTASEPLAGATITTESETELTVHTVLDPDEVSVTQLVRQLRFVALRMHRDATSALVGDGNPPEGETRDDHADRLYAMTDRCFERALARLDEVDALGLTRRELFELWVTARELERVADHAERIGTFAAEVDRPSGSGGIDELRRIGREARTVVTDAVECVVGDAGVSRARRALTRRETVRERTAEMDRRLFDSTDTEYRLVRVLDSLRRTAEHGGNIAERGIQAAIRRGDRRTRPGEE